MPGRSLCRAAGRVGAEQVVDRSIFRGVVRYCRSAVEVYVVDRLRTKTGHGKGAFHRKSRAEAFGMRGGHVMRVAALAHSQKENCVSAAVVVGLFEQSKTRGFADRYAFARSIERTTGRIGNEFQRVKTVQRRETQRIRAAHNGGIAKTGCNHPGGDTKRLRTARARGRKNDGCSGETEMPRYEFGDRKGAVRLLITKFVRQRPSDLIPCAIIQLRLVNSRRAGAQHDRDSVGTVVADGCCDAVD